MSPAPQLDDIDLWKHPGDGLGDMPCEGRQHWDHAKGAHPVQDSMLQVDLTEVPGTGQGAIPGVQVTHASPGQEGRTGEVRIDL